MSNTRRSRNSSRSPSPYHGSRYSRSLSRSSPRSRSRSRSYDFADAANPGNNLYVTGLPSKITKTELADHFACEGKVVDVHLVVDPYTRESRGFGFVTMGSIDAAERCMKYLDGSVLDGRVIAVEKLFFFVTAGWIADLHQISNDIPHPNKSNQTTSQAISSTQGPREGVGELPLLADILVQNQLLDAATDRPVVRLIITAGVDTDTAPRIENGLTLPIITTTIGGGHRLLTDAASELLTEGGDTILLPDLVLDLHLHISTTGATAGLSRAVHLRQ